LRFFDADLAVRRGDQHANFPAPVASPLPPRQLALRAPEASKALGSGGRTYGRYRGRTFAFPAFARPHKGTGGSALRNRGQPESGRLAIAVAVQLADAATGARLWAETYNRTWSTDAIFEISAGE